MAVDGGLGAKYVGNEAPSVLAENYQYSRKVDAAVLGLTKLGLRETRPFWLQLLADSPSSIAFSRI